MSQESTSADALLTTAQAAQRLGVKPQTLRKMRHQGRGPAYIRMGGLKSRAMYKPSAIDEWEAKRTHTGTTAETVAAAMAS